MLDLYPLQGVRARLEPLSEAHILGLTEAATEDRSSFRFTDVPANEASMRRYVETALHYREAGAMAPFAIIDCQTARIVGSTRFGNIEYWPWPPESPHQRGENRPDVVEIGWTWLASHAQGTGINRDAKLLMLTLAFETWRVHRVCLKTDARNERSRRAIERLGAHFDGVIRAAQMAYDGEIRNSAMYSILDGEWPAMKSNIASSL